MKYLTTTLVTIALLLGLTDLHLKAERDAYRELTEHAYALSTAPLSPRAAELAADLHKRQLEQEYGKIKTRIERINPKAPAAKIARAIISNADRYGLEPAVLAGVIEVESHYWPNAVGPDGERGVAQLMKGTARELGVPWDKAFDVDVSVEGGARYLAQQVKRHQSVQLGLYHYNGGPYYAAKVLRVVEQV